jgi:hypothetical protein
VMQISFGGEKNETLQYDRACLKLW